MNPKTVIKLQTNSVYGKLGLHRRVFVCSPLSAPSPEGITTNLVFARACVRDSFERGEAPYAPHLLYPQPGILNDHDEDERRRGIQAGLRYLQICAALACYVDRGVSRGMRIELRHALAGGTPIEFRRLDGRALPSATWLHANLVPHEECELCFADVRPLDGGILPRAHVHSFVRCSACFGSTAEGECPACEGSGVRRVG